MKYDSLLYDDRDDDGGNGLIDMYRRLRQVFHWGSCFNMSMVLNIGRCTIHEMKRHGNVLLFPEFLPCIVM